MEHDDRRPWLLLTVLKAWQNVENDESQNAAERAIVRAAAEITGLTAGVAEGVAGYIDGKEEGASPLGLLFCVNFLRRYAELAK